MEFSEKVVIVTGAGSGMGKATVRKLADLNATVYACDRDARGMAAFAQDTKVIPIEMDVSSSKQCDEVVDRVMDERGFLSGIVNFAGVVKRTGILDCTDEEFDYVMRINVNGCFYLTRAAARVMVPKGEGSIVNVSSIWSNIGAKGVLAYCTSKGAVSQITRSAALDLAGTGVRVNEIRPGETNTSMLSSERDSAFSADDLKAKLQEIAVSIPVKRLADPSEMADAAIFLLSDNSSYMQGSHLTVDGGYSAQ